MANSTIRMPRWRPSRTFGQGLHGGRRRKSFDAHRRHGRGLSGGREALCGAVAGKLCAELRHNVAYASDEDAAVFCVEHCGAVGACLQCSKAVPFDHLCIFSLISMHSVCAPHKACALRAVRSDTVASSSCCAPGRKRDPCACIHLA